MVKQTINHTVPFLARWEIFLVDRGDIFASEKVFSARFSEDTLGVRLLDVRLEADPRQKLLKFEEHLGRADDVIAVNAHSATQPFNISKSLCKAPEDEGFKFESESVAHARKLTEHVPTAFELKFVAPQVVENARPAEGEQ